MKMRNQFHRSLTFFVWAAVLLIVSSCATDQKATREMAGIHLKSGMANLESGHYRDALKELFEAQRLDPENPQVYYYMGVAYYGTGLKEEAALKFQKALSFKPDYSEAHNFIGLIRFEEGRYEESIQRYKQALANILYETPEFALNNLGKAYFKAGDYPAALAKFEEALRIKPNRILPIVHMNAGVLLLTMNRPREALAHLETSVELAPFIPEPRYWLARAHLMAGNKSKAVKELKRVIKLGPQTEFGMKAKELLGDR